MSQKPKDITYAENYVRVYYTTAVEAAKRYDTDPILLLSQSGLESAWGSSALSGRSWNFFGITAQRGTKRPRPPHWKGAVSPVVGVNGLRFCAYSSPLDSFLDYAWLIKRYYPTVYAYRTDYKAYAHAIAQSNYISEENGDDRLEYETTVRKNYERVTAIVDKLKKKGYLSQV